MVKFLTLNSFEGIFILMRVKVIDIDTLIDIFDSMSKKQSEFTEQEDGGD